MKLFSALGALLLSAAAAQASPAILSTLQHVHLKQDGPMLFAQVSSGVMLSYVIGYKSSGELAKDNPEFVDAIVMHKCDDNGSVYTSQTAFRLGREWHGTGYMTPELTAHQLLSSACSGKLQDMQIAFSSDGEWDSRFGANYRMESSDLSTMVHFNTKTEGMSINQPAWDFIIEKMKE